MLYYNYVLIFVVIINILTPLIRYHYGSITKLTEKSCTRSSFRLRTEQIAAAVQHLAAIADLQVLVAEGGTAAEDV